MKIKTKVFSRCWNI